MSAKSSAAATAIRTTDARVLTGAQIAATLPLYERLADATMWLGGMDAYRAVCKRRLRTIVGHETDFGALRREVAAIEQAAGDAGMPLGRGR